MVEKYATIILSAIQCSRTGLNIYGVQDSGKKRLGFSTPEEVWEYGEWWEDRNKASKRQ